MWLQIFRKRFKNKIFQISWKSFQLNPNSSVRMNTDMTMWADTFCNLTNGPISEWKRTSTSPHTAIYGQGQHWIHISYFIRNIVFHIVVRRYFSSWRPYVIKCYTNNQFLDQTEINVTLKHCKVRQSVRIKPNWFWDTYKLQAQYVDKSQCDSMLQLQYISHSYHSTNVKV
jgi:hypothetical protein